MKAIIPLIMCIIFVSFTEVSAQERIKSKVHTGVTLESLPKKIEELNKNNEEIISILTEEENADPKLKKYTLVTAVRQLTIESYDIISNSTEATMIFELGWAIEDGWIPLGGISFSDGRYYQALIKYK